MRLVLLRTTPLSNDHVVYGRAYNPSEHLRTDKVRPTSVTGITPQAL